MSKTSKPTSPSSVKVNTPKSEVKGNSIPRMTNPPPPPPPKK